MSQPTATRSDLQLGRRFLHLATGGILVTLYYAYLSHQQIVAVLGGLVGGFYLLEQIRLSYPELSNHLTWVNKFFLRAEERLKESASLPYLVGVLLTIVSFPKAAAVIAIYCLAIADPLSAVIGIQYGKKKIISGKTMEGSAAFFIATFLCSLWVLTDENSILKSIVVSFGVGVCATIFELIPIRLDDNLTIPLFVGLMVWSWSSVFGLMI